MITLITGTPGGGKTAHAVDLLSSEYVGRPVFVIGIRDLVVDHAVVPPVEQWTEEKASPEDPDHKQAWFTFPPNAVVVIDEAQTVFRPRPVGSKVPLEVQAFETHRHLGIDFVLITQHPNLIDSNIRRLVGRHRHIRTTALGRHMFEWQEVGDPDSTSSRALSAKTRYRLPKHVFGQYRSAELHTKTRTRMPWYVYLFFGAAILSLFLGWRTYEGLKTKVNPLPDAVKQIGVQSQATTGTASPVKTTAQYIADTSPRIVGLAHTAPKYDEITKPVDAPWPVGCMTVADLHTGKSKCRCIDQQGNNYATTDALCRSIVQNGVFKDWQGHAQTRDEAQPRRVSEPVVKEQPAGDQDSLDAPAV